MLCGMFPFLAYSTQIVCGTGVIGNWIESFDFGTPNFNAAAGGFNPATGVYAVTRTAYWYITACFLCDQGSGCNVRILYLGTPVAALGNVWSGNGNTRRDEMFCQNMVQFAVSFFRLLHFLYSV